MQSTTVTGISDAHATRAEAKRLGEQITELCSYIYAAESRLLTLIREFDEKKCWADLGLYSCAHWLNFKCGIGINAAREKVRVANALVKLPKISKRLSKGELSYSKVRAITRIADETNEDYLLMIAKHGTAHHVEKLVSKYRTAKRLQDSAVANEQYCDRELNHYYDHAGCLVIKARLPAEQGALIIKALEMAMDKDFPGATSVGGGDVGGGLAGDSQLEDGPHVTAETSRRIGCDCSIVNIKEGKNGEPLSIGRRSRSIPPPMRRALRIRDGGCRFPGCTNNRFVDGHHIKHWADGGETSLDNLVLLCRHHHHLVHEGGFACEKSVAGEIYFTDQRQEPLPQWAELPKVASDHDVQQWLDREYFEAVADSEGCAAQWYAGDRMDWQMAVSALFEYRP